MIVLGIDPGTVRTGYAVCSIQSGRISLLACDVISASATLSMPERLGIIHDGIDALIRQWGVAHVTLETSFLEKMQQIFSSLGMCVALFIC